MYPRIDTSYLVHSCSFSRIVSETLELTIFVLIFDEAILVHLISYILIGPLAFSRDIGCHDKTYVEESFLDADNARGGSLGSKRKNDNKNNLGPTN